MKRNVASQIVCAQLVSKTDGSAVTSGTTTVYVLGDGGTQGTGSVGSGAAAHEGNGVWSYAPAQAETNYDNVVFTFVNSSAVNASIQIYPSFPQTGDNFARLGAPAGASVSADVAAVKAVLPSALVSGRIDASVGAMASGVLTASAIAADAITDAKVASDVTIASVTGSVGSVTGSVGSVTGLTASDVGAIKAKTDQLTFSTANRVDAQVFGMEAGTVTAAAIATDAIDADAIKTDAVTEIQSGLSTLTAAGVRSAVGLASANLDTQLGTLATAANLATVAGYVDTEVAAIKTVTDKVNTALESDGGAGYQFTTTALENAPSGSGASAADIADAVWDEAIADHQGAGSTGESLNGAGSAGNPWVSVLEGSMNAGDMLRVIAAFAAGKTAVVKLGSRRHQVTFRDITDSSDIVSATVNNSQRTEVTVTP